MSDQHIPDRLVEKIHQRTIWMMAGGLSRFNDTFGTRVAGARRQQRFINDKVGNENIVDPVSMDQMKMVLTQCYLVVVWACIMLLIELIKFHIKKRRNRRIENQSVLEPQTHP